MIPRLQPRSSFKRPSGIENVFPIDANTNGNTRIPPTGIDTSTSSFSSFTRRPENPRGPLSTPDDKSNFPKECSSSVEQENQPFSPSRSTVECEQAGRSPVPNNHGYQRKRVLLDYTSSTSYSFEADENSMSYSDFSLTPPTAASRPPLLVSAKRYGTEVRRQHSKRRRRRRRPNSTKPEAENSSSVAGMSVNTTDSDYRNERVSDGLCLWKDDNPNETEDNYLPLLGSSDEDDEETDRIEELVRAEHRKEAIDARGSKELQRRNGSFSANRAPPPKGCLSNPRPKRPRDQATRYKTPPKSTHEIITLPLSNAHQPRRVQFGIPSAVEYEIDRPPGHLTPISQEITRKRYCMDPKEPTREEDEITQETKQNSMILSEWEDQLSTMTENKSRLSRSSSNKRRRKNRRSSSVFSLTSRISLAFDHSTQIHPQTNQQECTFNSSSSHSSPAIATRDMVSLSASSAEKTFEEISSRHATSQVTSAPSARLVDDNQSWHFVADLGSINSKGAMELSPHSLTPETKESVCGIGTDTITNVGNGTKNEEKIPPPLRVNLDTIHSAGAIGKDLPNHRHTTHKDCPSSDSSLPNFEGFKSDGSSKGISKTLIDSPWLDQEWDFVTLLRNLTSLRVGKETTFQRCFYLLDPCINNALSCTNDFVKQTMCTQSLKSSLPGNTSNEYNLFSNRSAVVTEWKESELSYIENLTNTLDQFRFGMEKTSVVANVRSTDLRPPEKHLQEEISKVENDIRELKYSLGLLEASIAPFLCISCQATSQIGIYGFYFEEFRDGHFLELEYIHAIFDVKTRVIVDINCLQRISMEYIDGASNRKQNPVFDFHRSYVSMLKCGNFSFPLNGTELQDYLLRLGQILGKLDQCALALDAVAETHIAVITVDLPYIRLYFPKKDATVLLTLDLESFQAKMMSASTTGMDTKVVKAKILSPVDCCDLQSLSNVISQYFEN